MPRSETNRSPSNRRAPDWRCWLTLAWVVWFGLLYGQMVVARRGAKLQALIRPAATQHRTFKAS
jgi:hypothetical protein